MCLVLCCGVPGSSDGRAWYWIGMEKDESQYGEREGSREARGSNESGKCRSIRTAMCLILFRPIFFFKKKDVIFTLFLLPIFFRKKVFSARVDVGYLWFGLKRSKNLLNVSDVFPTIHYRSERFLYVQNNKCYLRSMFETHSVLLLLVSPFTTDFILQCT